MGALIPDDERRPVPGALADGEWLNVDRAIGAEDLRDRGAAIVRWRAGDVRSIARLLRVQAVGRQRGVPTLAVHVPGHPAERRPACVENALLREQIELPVRQDPGGRLARRLGLTQEGSIALVDGEAHLGAHLPPTQDTRVGELLDGLGVGRDGEGGRWDLRGLAPGPEELSYVQGLSVEGDRLAIADTAHHRVLVGDHEGSVDQVVGIGCPGSRDGPLERAELSHPRGLWLSGDRLVIADSGNGAIRVADLAAGRVETLASARPLAGAVGSVATTGPIPWDVAPDPRRANDDTVLATLAGADALVSVPLATGKPDPVELPDRTLVQPTALATDGNQVYVADGARGAIRRLDADGRSSTILGSRDRGFGAPAALTLAPSGELVVADAYGSIWSVDPETGARAELAGRSGLEEPRALARAGDELIVAGSGSTLRGFEDGGDQTRSIDPEVPWPEADVQLELDPVEIAPGGRLTIRLVGRGAGQASTEAGRPDVRGPLSLRRTRGPDVEDPDLVLEVEGFVQASGPQTVVWSLQDQAIEHRAAWRFPVLRRPGADPEIEVVLSTKWPGS